MTITRIYTDDDGESHFETLPVSLRLEEEIGFLSDAIAVKSIIFREVLPDYDFNFHNAPQRQYIVLLDGQIEIETSLGEKKTFNGGDIILVEDTSGKGHRTRNLLKETRRSIFITF